MNTRIVPKLALSALLSLGLLSTSALASDAVVGALLGGGAGAFIGQSIGGRDGTIIGGAIGAATGAAIGSGHDRRGYRDRRVGYAAPRVHYLPPPPVYYSRPIRVVPAPMYYRQPVRIVETHNYYIKDKHHRRAYRRDRDDWGRHERDFNRYDRFEHRRR